MNVYRFLTSAATAAAGTALLAAVAPSAQALEFGNTLSSAAQTAATVAEKAEPVVDGVVGGKVNQKVGAVKGVVKAGADAVKAGNDLLS
ncbi:hypothetical protein [Streptomyces sp. NPDC088400]|jgi:hypothetical protein|uniref:hypothetical protein n=1 Tax=Streptomyces sp. NPDC088400 TaxID=3365861 RepID=UPI00380A10B0